ncbi:hypothetical protein [Sandarakinorhabdus sp.]|uniref:hypothetical protein n=1 Tax=Sandarakinorhabdus sp. TaxID=1916663 RepID=UPI00286E09AE|nr:hypothetical protein [Sandarakinorhabdus sp.]
MKSGGMIMGGRGGFSGPCGDVVPAADTLSDDALIGRLNAWVVKAQPGAVMDLITVPMTHLVGADLGRRVQVLDGAALIIAMWRRGRRDGDWTWRVTRLRRPVPGSWPKVIASPQLSAGGRNVDTEAMIEAERRAQHAGRERRRRDAARAMVTA